MTTQLSDRLVVTEAGEGSRAEIFRLRHEVYASELAQHAENEAGELRDGLDGRNVYLVVERGGELAGFVSVTPPSAGMYSVDKYFRRGDLPEGSVLAGAGSSDLIFRASRTWLRKDSRVLILDPTYGEYGSVLERVVGCEVVRDAP